MNILIVDDHPLTCQGLSALLTAHYVQAQLRTAHTAVEARASLQQPTTLDWLFLDIHLADDPHKLFFHEVCGSPWIERTVLISAEPGHALIHTALAAGARGFLPKTADPLMVLNGFAQILRGEFYVPPELSSCLFQPHAGDASLRGLSPRLLQVQARLLHGASNKVIARELDLSAHTVKEYVSSILAFHGVASRLDLILKGRATMSTPPS